MDNNSVASTSDIDSEIQQLESDLEELKSRKLKSERLAALRKEKSELQVSTEELEHQAALETNVQLPSQAANNNILIQNMASNSIPSVMEYLKMKIIEGKDVGWVDTREEINGTLKNLKTEMAGLAKNLFK